MPHCSLVTYTGGSTAQNAKPADAAAITAITAITATPVKGTIGASNVATTVICDVSASAACKTST